MKAAWRSALWHSQHEETKPIFGIVPKVGLAVQSHMVTFSEAQSKLKAQSSKSLSTETWQKPVTSLHVLRHCEHLF